MEDRSLSIAHCPKEKKKITPVAFSNASYLMQVLWWPRRGRLSITHWNKDLTQAYRKRLLSLVPVLSDNNRIGNCGAEHALHLLIRSSHSETTGANFSAFFLQRNQPSIGFRQPKQLQISLVEAMRMRHFSSVSNEGYRKDALSSRLWEAWSVRLARHHIKTALQRQE